MNNYRGGRDGAKLSRVEAAPFTSRREKLTASTISSPRQWTRTTTLFD